MISRLILLSLFTSILTQPLKAQNDYLITLRGDTLRGDVRLLTYEKIDRVEIRVDGKRKSFSALEARTVFSDNEMYHTMSLPGNGLRFMKLIKSGYLSLYSFRTLTQPTYSGLFLIKRAGIGLEVPNLTYKKTMTEYMGDCPTLAERIKAGEFPKNTLEKLVDEYNACKENAATVTTSAPELSSEDELSKALSQLIGKIESETFSTKKDALDILTDIRNKSSRKEAIPNYLVESLKSTLKDQTSLAGDLEKLVALLQK